MKIISIITEKGGVGKTTTSIHLGASFAQKGFKTLLIDFDAQRNLSIGMKVPKDFGYTVKNFLQSDFQNFKLINKNDKLFILAGDREIEKKNYSRVLLSKNIKILEELNFDYVIIDCPPRPITIDNVGLGEMALVASDFVISPIEAEEYSIEGINELLPSVVRIKTTYNSKLEFLGFFFNKVISNTINFKKYRSIALNQASGYFFTNHIRQDVCVEKAKEQGETVYITAPNSRAVKDYENLVQEILKKIKHKSV